MPVLRVRPSYLPTALAAVVSSTARKSRMTSDCGMGHELLASGFTVPTLVCLPLDRGKRRWNQHPLRVEADSSGAEARCCEGNNRRAPHCEYQRCQVRAIPFRGRGRSSIRDAARISTNAGTPGSSPDGSVKMAKFTPAIPSTPSGRAADWRLIAGPHRRCIRDAGRWGRDNWIS
jgi:hypothetical protein